MDIKVLGKEIKVTEAINGYVEKKLERIDKYFENSSAEVTIKAEKRRILRHGAFSGGYRVGPFSGPFQFSPL